MLWRLRSNQKWQKPRLKTYGPSVQFPLIFLQQNPIKNPPTTATHSSEYGDRFELQFRPQKLQAAACFRSRQERDSRTGSVLKKKATYNMGDYMAGRT
jgi:hypothetical protein